MLESVIRLEKVGKRYRIGKERYHSLREDLTHLFSRKKRETVWALKDVSFEVKEGEVLGIIGPNGAGKTTILKLLAGITLPTEGKIGIKGKVASLIEIGAGIHPELTGRENVSLYGSIMGLKKREIDKKFDEIVDFAGIEKFLDTPVKYYSSGMQMRLGFSVAAHIQPDILLVDEVLAVGDIAFQKKCLGKMDGVAKSGRTVLFVSHNMGAIRSLCGSAIWLDNGQIVKGGAVDEIVRDYEESQLRCFDESSYIVERNPEEVSNKSFYFSRVEMLNEKGEHATIFRYNEKLILMVDLTGEPMIDSYGVSCHIYNELGQLVSICSSGAYHGIYFNKGTKRIRIEIGPLIFTSGRYTISLLSWYGEGRAATQADGWKNACAFTLECLPFRPGYDISTAKGGACIIQQSFSATE